jgi:hypothetical protein
MKLLAGTLLAATFAVHGIAQEPERLRPLPEVSVNLKTGPEIGAAIPQFALRDQTGASRSLQDLSGPKGLVLAFVRSADW